MAGTYKVDRTPTGHIRIENQHGQYGIYGPDGTHKHGHQFGWLTMWCVIRQFKLYGETVIRLV